jgi:hypothetical protein
MAYQAAKLVESASAEVSAVHDTVSGTVVGLVDVAKLSFPATLSFSLEDLEQVSQSKSAQEVCNAKTILHWCGNKWCLNPTSFFCWL